MLPIIFHFGHSSLNETDGIEVSALSKKCIESRSKYRTGQIVSISLPVCLGNLLGSVHFEEKSASQIGGYVEG